MNHIRIHYAPDTGRILAWDNAQIGPALMGGEIAIIEVPEGHDVRVDPTAQRIDLTTLELETMSEAEIAAARSPAMWEVTQAAGLELIDTDAMTAPDRNVPNRNDWLTYRQALRDLSKGDPKPTAAQMVTAFPVRPDGRDAAAALRERLPQG